MRYSNFPPVWFKNHTALLLALVFAHGCTGRKVEDRKVPDLSPRQEPIDDKGSGSQGGRGSVVDTEEASAVIAISEEELKKAAPKEKLDLSSLEYKVTYQDTVIGPAPLNFKNGKAIITLNELPANQIGDLKFEVIADDKTKLAATVPDVILPPQQVSAVDVTLAPATDNGGGTTGSGGSGTATGTSTGSKTGTATGTSTGAGTSTGTGVNPGARPGTGTSVAPSLWDGKSDKGNKLWKIKSL